MNNKRKMKKKKKKKCWVVPPILPVVSCFSADSERILLLAGYGIQGGPSGVL
jgi:hypothetical protein